MNYVLNLNSIQRGMFGVFESGEETAVRFFNDWIEQVKSEVPSDRLLVFQVKEGWAPLCQFLGVPVPEESFPNVNDTAGTILSVKDHDVKSDLSYSEMKARLRSMKLFCLGLWSVAVAGTGLGLYYFQEKLPTQQILSLLKIKC